MSTEPQKEESDEKRTEDVEVEIVPEGTFGGKGSTLLGWGI
jgi:hypothetical protein